VCPIMRLAVSLRPTYRLHAPSTETRSVLRIGITVLMAMIIGAQASQEVSLEHFLLVVINTALGTSIHNPAAFPSISKTTHNLRHSTSNRPAAHTQTSISVTTHFYHARYSMPDQIMQHLPAAVEVFTRFLHDEMALPDVLKQYGALLLALTSGATATALFRYFKQYLDDRMKIKLAIFHILCTIENHPHYQVQLQLGNPYDLILDIDAKVNRMIDRHLTKDQAASAMTELKRKIWTAVDENRALGVKRQMIDAAAVKATIDEEDVAMDGPAVEPVHTPGNEAAAKFKFTLPSSKAHSVGEYNVAKDDATTVLVQAPVDMAAVRVRSVSPLTEAKIQTQLLCEQQELEDMDMVDIDDVLPTRTAPSEHDATTPTTFSSPEMPTPETPCPRPISPPRGGYGLDYSNRALYSSSPESYPSCSPDPSPACSPVPSSPFTSATNKVKTLQATVSLVLDQKPLIFLPDASLTIRKPKNITLSLPKANSCRQMRSRDLFPIPEVLSPQHSPLSDTTYYRVAESRAFNKEVKSARKQRHDLWSLFKQEEEIARALEQPSVSSSCSEIFRDSSTNAVCVLEEAATLVQQQPTDFSPFLQASRSSSPDAVSVAEEAVAQEVVAEGAVTPAPPVEKSARSPKTPQTPRSVRGKFSDTSAEVRRSARKGTFKGKYTR
jgi:hypothetical protein